MNCLLKYVAMSSLDRHKVVMHIAQLYLHNVLLSNSTLNSSIKNMDHEKFKV